MTIELVFETHSFSEDNERGIATGWLPGRLSDKGRESAERLGQRRRGNGIDVVFASDLRRAVETAEIAFAGTSIPLLLDWRLRECDYGEQNGTAATIVKADPLERLDAPFPGGESWRQAVSRVGRFFHDLPSRWDGKRVLVVGHMATRYACEHYLKGMPLEKLLAEELPWQEGWEYRLKG